ncbi:MAG: RsmE family RNA methyltransferase [Myxococcota bacterium]
MVETHRAYVCTKQLQQARVGNAFVLPQEACHRFVRVLRLPCHTPVALFDGTGLAVYGKLNTQATPVCLTHIRLQQNRRPLPHIYLAQALSRPSKLQEVVRCCTQLAVQRFIWFHSSRCTHTPADIGLKQLQHLQRIAQDAVRQSQQWHTPDMQGPVAFDDLVAVCKTFDGLRIMGDATADIWLSTHLQHTHVKQQTGSVNKALIIVGPEGGFDNSQKQALQNAGVVCVRWAPFVLRTQLAGAVALAALHSVLRSS